METRGKIAEKICEPIDRRRARPIPPVGVFGLAFGRAHGHPQRSPQGEHRSRPASSGHPSGHHERSMRAASPSLCGVAQDGRYIVGLLG